MIYRLIVLLYFLVPSVVFAQDTSFRNKHSFPTPVRNVLVANGSVYAKTGDGLYKLDKDQWRKENLKFRKTFVFYENGFFETDFIPSDYEISLTSMQHLVPQYLRHAGTLARLDHRLFISVGGSLYEYQITEDYSRTYPGFSIRDVFIEPGLKVVISYSGIFINDSIRVDTPYYANGGLTRVGNRYFLGSDRLFEFTPPRTFREIPTGHNLFAGYSRKVMPFQGRIHALNTKSLNWFDDTMQLHPIQQGYEYYDMEEAGGKLVVSTQSGECFVYDGQNITQLCKLSSRVRDVYTYGNTVYLSSNDGVYTIQNLDSSTLSLFAPLPFAVGVKIDALRNTWIATENGLYVLPDKRTDFIPYIPDVEFNRNGLEYYDDVIYAGSIEGLFVIDTYHTVQVFLPRYYDRQRQQGSRQRNELLISLAAVAFAAFAAGYGFHRYRKKQRMVRLPEKPKEKGDGLEPEEIAEAIRSHNLMTVDALAEYYQTNTVQLNRRFKVLNTTPGKFMKKVKLDYAREMLSQKVPMEEVVRKTGYSAFFIRQALGKRFPTA